MNRRAIVLALVVLVAVGSAAVLLGVPGLGSDAPAPTEAPDASTGGSGGGGGGSGGGGGGSGGGNEARAGTPTATPTPPFTFDIEQLSECGRTCRDVTATVTNEQDTTAADVTVRTRIYAGQSTAKGDRIWKGSEAVGTLGPGESATSSARVKLGVFAAAKVKGSDGWITVVTTVDSADRTLTFRSQRKVI